MTFCNCYCFSTSLTRCIFKLNKPNISFNKDGKPPALAGNPAKASHMKTIPAKKMSRPLSPRKKKERKSKFCPRKNE